MRALTANFVAELTKGAVAPIIIVELDFPSGMVRVWSGVGDLPFGGQTYKGVGALGEISPIGETANFEARGIGLRMSGIPSEYVSLVLDDADTVQGRNARIWIGFMDAAGTLIADPSLHRFFIDTMQIEDGAETCTITVQAESRAVLLKRKNERRWTHQDQQLDYPGDRFFEYVDDLQNKEFHWKPIE